MVWFRYLNWQLQWNCPVMLPRGDLDWLGKLNVYFNQPHMLWKQDNGKYPSHSKADNEALCLIGLMPPLNKSDSHGPLGTFVKLRVVYAPGMPGTFFSPPRVSEPNMHHGTFVMHAGSLISGFLWSRWRGKRSRHPRRTHNPQFYVSGKRPIRLKQLTLSDEYHIFTLINT